MDVPPRAGRLEGGQVATPTVLRHGSMLRTLPMLALFASGCVAAATPGETPGPGETPTPDDLPALEAACAELPTTPDEGWPGLLHDAHVHTSAFDEQSQADFALALLREMNAAGVGRAVVLGGHPGTSAAVRAEISAIEDEWAPLLARCDRLLVQINSFDPTDPAAVDLVAEKLDSATFAGVGAVDISHPDGEVDPLAPGLPPIYDLLAERGLPFQFHGLTTHLGPTDFPERMLDVVDTWPDLQWVWFGCPPTVRFGQLPENLTCAVLPETLECAPPCAGEDEAALSQTVSGVDTGPLGFNPWPTGRSPQGYDSFAEGVTEARSFLGAMPEELAATAARGRFEAVFGP